MHHVVYVAPYLAGNTLTCLERMLADVAAHPGDIAIRKGPPGPHRQPQRKIATPGRDIEDANRPIVGQCFEVRSKTTPEDQIRRRDSIQAGEAVKRVIMFRRPQIRVVHQLGNEDSAMQCHGGIVGNPQHRSVEDQGFQPLEGRFLSCPPRMP